MTALSGGEQLDDERAPQNSVLERSDAAAGDEPRAARPLEEMFPLRGDVTRARQMQETWCSFGAEMEEAVQAALDTSRSPPEIAYAIGGIVHNYFRTRGVTLTSYELRRLVGELLVLRQREPAAPLVTFTAEPAAAETSWTGDEPGTPGPVVPDLVFDGPPSPLVDVASRMATPRCWGRGPGRACDDVRRSVRSPGRRRCDRGDARRAPARRAGKGASAWRGWS